MGEAIYAIGDIHGRLDDLRRVHDLIARDQAEHGCHGATLVHLGDLVDRGPDSAGVIGHLLAGIRAGAPWVVLKGNHDRMAQKFAEDPDWVEPVMRAGLTWLHDIIGGKETLASYGIDARSGKDWHALSAEFRRAMPPEHLAYLRDLPVNHRHGDFLFVHAGLRPGVALRDQSEDDMIWIRGEFHSHRGPFGPLVIHGHTVVEQVTHYGNRISIDTGAGYGRPISAIVIDRGQAFVLESGGRRRLQPG